jgi:abnormal spindle-like microcephaly-associated protein
MSSKNTKDERELFFKGLQGEIQNFEVIQKSTEMLGCIPYILNVQTFSNEIPDDKTVVIFLSYLCSRILSLKEER